MIYKNLGLNDNDISQIMGIKKKLQNDEKEQINELTNFIKKRVNNIKPKTLRQIKEYDVFDIKEKFTDVVPQDYKYEPVFNTGVIKFDLPSEILKTKDVAVYSFIDGDKNKIECYLYNRQRYEFELIFICDMNSVTPENRKPDFDYIQSEWNERMSLGVLAFIVEAMGYLSYKLSNRNTIYKTNRATRTSSSSKSKPTPQRRHIQAINEDKVIYVINTNNLDYMKEIRKYQRRTEAWSVIGHKRVYKSGKEVWVKPYTKGDGRNTGKTYILQK